MASSAQLPTVSSPIPSPEERVPADASRLPARPKRALRRRERLYWPALLWSAAAGGAGGLLGWAIGEPFNPAGASAQGFGLYLGVLLYFLVISAGIGGALGALPGILNRSWRQALRGAAIAAVVGGVVGGLGGLPAQYVYDALGAGLLARAAGWAIVGAAIGLCPGAATRDLWRMLRGAIGGLTGGFVGGLLFDPIANIFQTSASDTGTASRFVADLVVGLLIGVMVAVVEVALKRSWLTVVSGRREGAQLILSKQSTSIGCDDRDDMILWGDSLLASRHACIRRARRGHVLESAARQAPTLLNGQPVAGPTALRDGDEIQLGQTRLVYHAQGAGPAPAEQSAAPSQTTHPRPALPQPVDPYLPATMGTARPMAIVAAQPAPMSAPPPQAQDDAMRQRATEITGRALESAAAGAIRDADAPVAAPRECRLRLVDGRGMALELPARPMLTMGRAAGNDVMIADDTVSSRHAELRREGDGWVVIDRDSTNGTYVSPSGLPADERRVTRCVLQAGATLRLGGVIYRVEDVL